MKLDVGKKSTWGGLAGAGDDALKAVLLLEDAETVGLRGNSTAAGHHVEGSALSDKDLADGSVNVSAGLDGLQDLAFLDVPLDTMLFVRNVGGCYIFG